jgi:hypothetical protein
MATEDSENLEIKRKLRSQKKLLLFPKAAMRSISITQSTGRSKMERWPNWRTQQQNLFNGKRYTLSPSVIQRRNFKAGWRGSRNSRLSLSQIASGFSPLGKVEGKGKVNRAMHHPRSIIDRSILGNLYEIVLHSFWA